MTQIAAVQYSDPTLGSDPVWGAYPVDRERTRWMPIILCFAIGFVGHLASSWSLQPAVSMVSYATACMLGVLFLRTWEFLILLSALATIDHLPMWVNQGMSVFEEPLAYKAVKDVLLLAALVSTLKIHRVGGRHFSMSFVLFAMYLCFRGLLNPGAIGLTAVKLRYLVAYPFLAFMLVGAFRPSERLDKFLKVLCVIAVAAVFLGVSELLLGRKTYYSGYVTWGPIRQRIVSTLGNPNNLGFFLQLPFLYLVAGLFLRRVSVWKAIPLALILFIGIFLTFSRTTLLLGVVGVLVITILVRNFRATALTGTAILLAIPIGYVFFTGRIGSNAFGDRFDMLKNEVRMSMQSGAIFMVGRGLGGGLRDVEGEIRVHVTDNVFTDMLRRTGILGFGLFMLFIISLTTRYLRARHWANSPVAWHAYVSLFAWHVVFILYGLAVPAWSLYPASLMYWIPVSFLLGLPYAPEHAYGETETGWA